MEGCERRARGRKRCKRVAFLSLFDEKLKIQDKEYLKATPKLSFRFLELSLVSMYCKEIVRRICVFSY